MTSADRSTRAATVAPGSPAGAGAASSPPVAQAESLAPGMEPGKLGMVIFLATDVMGFGGLLLAYAVLRVRERVWPDPALRFDRMTASLLTFALLLSGASMGAALAAARAGRRATARRWLVATALLGLVFLAGQAAEFRALAVERHVGLTLDHAASLFYVIAGYHGLHVLVGGVMLGLLASGPARAERAGPGVLEVAALYWQFVDLIWIVIFTAIYLLPPGSRG